MPSNNLHINSKNQNIRWLVLHNSSQGYGYVRQQVNRGSQMKLLYHQQFLQIGLPFFFQMFNEWTKRKIKRNDLACLNTDKEA